jgi:hypothetical protein
MLAWQFGPAVQWIEDEAVRKADDRSDWMGWVLPPELGLRALLLVIFLWRSSSGLVFD